MLWRALQVRLKYVQYYVLGLFTRNDTVGARISLRRR